MSMWALDRGVQIPHTKFSPEGKWCKKVFKLCLPQKRLYENENIIYS